MSGDSKAAAAAASQCAAGAGAGCDGGACAAAAGASAQAPGQASFDFKVPPPAASHALHSGYFHPVLKKWANDQVLSHSDLMYPVFVVDDDDAKQEIKAMPGQYRWGVNRLAELLTPLVTKGLQAIILFGVLGDNSAKLKDANGTFATNEQSPVVKALRLCRLKYPTLLLACDVCLCAYTDHGHCGIVKANGDIDNTPSIQRIAELAVFYAQNGAHCVAPSDMMDGRIAAIKHGLRAVKLDGSVNVMSYSSKFASVMYGPFRDAAASGMAFGDRSKYQLPPFSRGLALRALERDVAEGADSVMVKPGGPYLDLVRDARERVNVPIAIYHVSGEFAMLYHAAAAGAFDLTKAVMETVGGFRRAGAKIIITYFVDLILDALNAEHHKTTHPLIKSAL